MVSAALGEPRWVVLASNCQLQSVSPRCHETVRCKQFLAGYRDPCNPVGEPQLRRPIPSPSGTLVLSPRQTWPDQVPFHIHHLKQAQIHDPASWLLKRTASKPLEVRPPYVGRALVRYFERFVTVVIEEAHNTCELLLICRLREVSRRASFIRADEVVLLLGVGQHKGRNPLKPRILLDPRKASRPSIPWESRQEMTMPGRGASSYRPRCSRKTSASSPPRAWRTCGFSCPLSRSRRMISTSLALASTSRIHTGGHSYPVSVR